MEEQAASIQAKAHKVNVAANAASTAVTALANPVTLVIAAVVGVALVVGLLVVATTQTLGRNSNACKNGEDCSIAEPYVDPACSEAVALSGSDNIEKAYNYMVGKGYPPAMAAGIAGNFKAESGAVPWVAEYGYPPASGSPYVVGSDGSGPRGWGIGQWSFGRHIALKNYVIGKVGRDYYVSQYTNGNPPLTREQEDTLLGVQLDFMLSGEPAEKSNIEAVRNADTPEAAARIFHDEWERSAGWNPIRATYAREIFNRLGGSGGGSGGGTSAASCSGGGPVGDLCGGAPTPYNGSLGRQTSGTTPQAAHARDELLRLCSSAMPAAQDCSAQPSRPSSSGHYHGVSCDIFPKGAGIGVNSCGQASSPGCTNGNSIAAWLVKYHSELKVEYVIWDAKIWSASGGWGPRPYGGCGPTVCNTSATALHQDHVHVSMVPGP